MILPIRKPIIICIDYWGETTIHLRFNFTGFK